MKILSIGNSFSQDAQRYLHDVAKSDNYDINCVNLYIGGCTLETHYNNMINDASAYVYQLNGVVTDRLLSIKQALLEDDWDYVTFQQASYLSGYIDTYSPYIEELIKYVKGFIPNVKIIIHQTWAYPDGSEMFDRVREFKTAEEMLNAIKNAYDIIAKKVNADLFIPSGEVIELAIKMGLSKPYRDSLHVSFGAGRFLLALCWYKKLTGNDISLIKFNDFDEEVTETDKKIIVDAVNSVI